MATTPRILIVEDEEPLTLLLRYNLEAEGYAVETVARGDEAELRLRETVPDLVLLDWMLPGLSGIELCRRLRQRPDTQRLPVIMLTARGDDLDRIAGLELGADDYVPKPCSPRELAARIRAILKRSSGQVAAMPSVIVSGSLTVWSAQRRAERDGKALELTSTEFNLVEVLARNAGRPVSKAELSEEALGRALTRFDRSIDVHMSSIRQKLGNLADGRSCIQTVIRKGYQLVVE